MKVSLLLGLWWRIIRAGHQADARLMQINERVDQLFREKYSQVDAGSALNVAGCLGRELAAAG